MDHSSRRDFLARTVAAGAAAAFAGGCTSGGRTTWLGAIPQARTRRPLADDEPICVGVIGTGGMGTGHCHRLADFARDGQAHLEIRALSDVCVSRMESARKQIMDREHKGPIELYQDYRDMLARDDLHAILIASPEHWHSRHAEDAILSGHDVYVEKPMTLDLADALRLRRVVQANPDSILQVGTQKIMLPKFQAARKIIAEGGIGKPTFSQTSYCRNSLDGEWLYYQMRPEWVPGPNLDWDAWCEPLGKAPWDPAVYARWRRYRKYSTGIIGDLLVHQMTPMMLALDAGWPVRVVATGGHYIDKAMENHDQVNINIQFEKEHTMIVAGSTCNEVGLETMIRGHQANIYLNSRHCVVRPERLFVDDVDEQKVECEDIGSDHDRLRMNWLKCIRTREQPDSDVDLGTKVMVVVDLATRSLWDGRAYGFDPETMKAGPV
jgi:predicted dehydrogenase